MTTEQTVHQSVETLIRNWWLVALRGAVALIFGVLTVLRPAVTLSVLILLFGGYAIANGVFTVVAAIAKRRGEPHWVSLLVSGVLSIALGVLTFFMPRLTAIALLYIIAAWAIVTGISEIITAVRLRRVITGEWLLIVAGVLSVLFGVFLIVSPGAGALAVTLWIGTYAIMVGILLLALAFRLRSWGHAHGTEGAARTT
jgi:uncharacterized membrane protein HdeD (DUF308 family)